MYSTSTSKMPITSLLTSDLRSLLSYNSTPSFILLSTGACDRDRLGRSGWPWRAYPESRESRELREDKERADIKSCSCSEDPQFVYSRCKLRQRERQTTHNQRTPIFGSCCRLLRRAESPAWNFAATTTKTNTVLSYCPADCLLYSTVCTYYSYSTLAVRILYEYPTPNSAAGVIHTYPNSNFSLTVHASMRLPWRASQCAKRLPGIGSHPCCRARPHLCETEYHFMCCKYQYQVRIYGNSRVSNLMRARPQQLMILSYCIIIYKFVRSTKYIILVKCDGGVMPIRRRPQLFARVLLHTNDSRLTHRVVSEKWRIV